ncbi:MAG: hypothetical protein ACRERE_40415 [Candidatus Entotheonellia bacterium]
MNALLIVVWVAAMWAIGPVRIIGFTHIPTLMALATSGAMLAAAIGVNSPGIAALDIDLRQSWLP